jgi:hypothetical protein
LSGTVIKKRLLQAMPERILAKSLDGDNASTFDLRHWDHASTDHLVIKQHGAGTAITGVAADLCTG